MVRATAEGRIEVDEVDPVGALVTPAARGVERIAEDPFGTGDALHELDGLAALDIDSGKQHKRIHVLDPSPSR